MEAIKGIGTEVCLIEEPKNYAKVIRTHPLLVVNFPQ